MYTRAPKTFVRRRRPLKVPRAARLRNDLRHVRRPGHTTSVGLAGHNALAEPPCQALMQLNVEAFGLDVFEGTSEPGARRRPNPIWLHQTLYRKNKRDVASDMIDKNQFATGTKHTFHLRNGLTNVGYAAHRKGAHHGVEAAFRKREGLGIADPELDTSAQLSRTLARDLEHARTEIDACQPDTRWIEGDVSTRADRNLKRIALGLRARPRSVVGKEELLEKAHLLVVPRRKIIPIFAMVLGLVFRAIRHCAPSPPCHGILCS